MSNLFYHAERLDVFVENKLLRIHIVQVPFEAVTFKVFSQSYPLGNIPVTIVFLMKKEQDGRDT